MSCFTGSDYCRQLASTWKATLYATVAGQSTPGPVPLVTASRRTTPMLKSNDEDEKSQKSVECFLMFSADENFVTS